MPTEQSRDPPEREENPRWVFAHGHPKTQQEPSPSLQPPLLCTDLRPITVQF